LLRDEGRKHEDPGVGYLEFGTSAIEGDWGYQ
jgi:hypothetical protein